MKIFDDDPEEKPKFGLGAFALLKKGKKPAGSPYFLYYERFQEKKPPLIDCCKPIKECIKKIILLPFLIIGFILGLIKKICSICSGGKASAADGF